MIRDYLHIAAIIVCIDYFYLKTVSKFFNNQINKIQGSNIELDYVATILAYLLISVGVYYFVIIKQFNIKDTFILGIFTYGIYELTNKAIFKNWDWSTVLLDGIWGGILFSLTHFIYKNTK